MNSSTFNIPSCAKRIVVPGIAAVALMAPAAAWAILPAAPANVAPPEADSPGSPARRPDRCGSARGWFCRTPSAARLAHGRRPARGADHALGPDAGSRPRTSSSRRHPRPSRISRPPTRLRSPLRSFRRARLSRISRPLRPRSPLRLASPPRTTASPSRCRHRRGRRRWRLRTPARPAAFFLGRRRRLGASHS